MFQQALHAPFRLADLQLDCEADAGSAPPSPPDQCSPPPRVRPVLTHVSGATFDVSAPPRAVPEQPLALADGALDASCYPRNGTVLTLDSSSPLGKGSYTTVFYGQARTRSPPLLAPSART